MVTRLMSPLNSIEYGFRDEPIEKILFRKLEAYFRDITVTALSYLSSILAGYLRKNCTHTRLSLPLRVKLNPNGIPRMRLRGRGRSRLK